MKKVLFFAFAISTLFLSCKKDDANLEPVKDIDGNEYTVVKIGDQYWMTENLKVSKYKDGTTIATGLSDSAWDATAAGAYALHGDLASNNEVYGKLYNWHAASSGKLAPTGWHVPTRAEWTQLVEFLGGSSVAGGKLKSTSSLWVAPNAGADNSSGFAGLPGGNKSNLGGYVSLGEVGYFWASSERNSTQGDYTSLLTALASSASNGATKEFGMSVRCVKD
jgi:uncharacterized protein (TIGR02145 family)